MNVKAALIITAVLSLTAAFLVYGSPDSDGSETVPDGTVYTYETHGSGHPNYYCIITGAEGSADLVYVPAVLEGYDVRGISSHAFDGCGMAEVVVPSVIESIDAGAFSGCTGLKDAYFLGDRPDMDGAFAEGVTLHVLPGKQGWKYEEAITTAYGAGIDYALMPDGWMVMGGAPADGVLDIKPEFAGYRVTSIAPYAFSGTMRSTGEVDRRTDIRVADLPDTVVSVRERAFYYCDVENVSFPSSLRYIHDEAFRAAEHLVSVELNDGLEFIGFEAFRECDSILYMEIPDSVSHAGQGCFKWCDGMASATVGRGIDSIPAEMFFYCRALESVAIPEGIAGIGVQAFSTCISLRGVDLPDSVRSIGDEAFRGCTVLSGPGLGGAERIGQSAFRDCKNLGTFALPASVSVMRGYCFADCGSITMKAQGECPEVSESAFINTDATVRCPAEYAASWSELEGVTVIQDDGEGGSRIAWVAAVIAVAIVVMSIVVYVSKRQRR